MRYEKIERFRNMPDTTLFRWLYGLLGVLVILLLAFLVNEKNWRPVKGKPNWTVRSNYSQELVQAVVDQNIKTAWSSSAPATSGMFIELDIQTPTRINGVVLHSEKKGSFPQPEGLIVKASLDGQHWQAVALPREISASPLFALTFAPVKARYLQIIEPSVVSTIAPWVIHELDLLQPIFPWQVERSVLLHAIIGILLAIGWFLTAWFADRDLLAEPPDGIPWLSGWIKPALFLTILLVGWSLRAAIIPLTQVSSQDLDYLFFLDAETSTDAAWSVKYFQGFGAGGAWLSLLLMRWWYRLYADYGYALRITGSVFGTCVIGLAPIIWKNFLGHKHIWQPALCAAALVSVSGLHLSLSRTADVSGALVFFVLLYLLLAFRLLYQQGSWLWAVALGIMLPGAFLIAPAMWFLPLGILVFAGLHGLIQWRQGRCDRLRLFMPRYGLYVASCVPFYAALLLMRMAWTWPLDFMHFAVNGAAIYALFQAVQCSGFLGIPAWIFWGLVCVGAGYTVRQRSMSAGFFYSQGLVLLVCAPDKAMTQGVIAVMAIFLGIRGLQEGLAWSSTRIRGQQAGWLQFAAYALVFGYMGGFAVNSLLIGNPNLPHAPELVRQLLQARTLHHTIEGIHDDRNDCIEMAVLGADATDMYVPLYRLNARHRFDADELQRRVAQRLLPTYLWRIGPAEAQVEAQTLTALAQPYYAELFASQLVSIYALRPEFFQLPKRYLWQDLYRGIGETRTDRASISGKVGCARPEEHQPGLLSFGPYTPMCASGSYVARFALRAKDLLLTAAPVARLEVMADTYTTLAQAVLTGGDFPDSDRYYTFDLSFTLDVTTNPAFQVKRLQFLVHFTGQAELRLDYIDLIPQSAQKIDF